MLNKKLVLGSLAGATLLVGAMVLAPSAAVAAVNGSCVLCHTMHASVEGVTTTPNGDLLKAAGCVGCHATAANGANGMGGAPVAAPQVGLAASATMNAGGYFNTALGETSHSVTDFAFGGVSALTTAPGGTMASAAFICQDCHTDTAAGTGHHSTSAGYRLITGVTSTEGLNYGNLANLNTYDSVSLNGFCASCHADFHDAGTTGGAQTGAAGAWIRHPTNITSTTANSELIATGAANEVMCLSCHLAHGGPYADLLRFDYTAQIAGAGGATPGCETCHGAK